MEMHPFGPTQRQVPAIGQGTWYIERAPRASAVAALRRGLDLGLQHIDTAEMYGSGAAEEVVGEAIAGRREEVFLVSKVLPQNASLRGTLAACEQSLKRLRTDRLDCYLLHWRGQHPLEQTIAAFDQLQQAGKIAAWGVSNFDVRDLDEVIAIAGAGKLACNQVLYHLQERAIEHGVLPWCEKHGWRWSATARSGITTFRARAPPAAACWKKLRARMERAHAKSRCAFSRDDPRCSPFRRHRLRSTPKTTQVPASCS